MAVIDKIPNSLYHHGHYYSNEFYFSPSYQTLTKAGRDLLHCMLSELRFSRKKGGNREKQYPNNGEISFTELQFKEMFGYSSRTYLKSRNILIEVGLIRQTYRGGKCRGDMAQYKILCVSDVLLREQRWQDYPNKNWTDEIPKAKDTQVGIETRFQKGKSGGKIEPTLPKYTLNGSKPPIGVSPNGILLPTKFHPKR